MLDLCVIDPAGAEALLLLSSYPIKEGFLLHYPFTKNKVFCEWTEEDRGRQCGSARALGAWRQQYFQHLAKMEIVNERGGIHLVVPEPF